jgi:hypothetical protein
VKGKMAEINQVAETVAATAAKASATAYTTGGSAALFGFLAQVDWMQAVGATTLLGTFLVNWYYKHKHYKLEVKKSEQP